MKPTTVVCPYCYEQAGGNPKSAGQKVHCSKCGSEYWAEGLDPGRVLVVMTLVAVLAYCAVSLVSWAFAFIAVVRMVK